VVSHRHCPCPRFVVVVCLRAPHTPCEQLLVGVMGNAGSYPSSRLRPPPHCCCYCCTRSIPIVPGLAAPRHHPARNCSQQPLVIVVLVVVVRRVVSACRLPIPVSGPSSTHDPPAGITYFKVVVTWRYRSGGCLPCGYPLLRPPGVVLDPNEHLTSHFVLEEGL
jgi:hypothetical protein